MTGNFNELIDREESSLREGFFSQQPVPTFWGSNLYNRDSMIDCLPVAGRLRRPSLQ